MLYTPLHRALALGLLIAAAGVPSACNSDDPQACDKIAEACHPVDKGPGSGKPHDCHRISHTDDVKQCNNHLSDCVGFCTSAAAAIDGGGAGGEGGAGGSGGAGGNGGAGGSGGAGASDARGSSPDGPAPDAKPAPSDTATLDTGGGAAVSEACTRYCACVTRQCAAKTGAPAWVKTAALCPAQCAMFSAQQLTCWSGFCNPTAATVSAHNCEHAWGANGTMECAN